MTPGNHSIPQVFVLAHQHSRHVGLMKKIAHRVAELMLDALVARDDAKKKTSIRDTVREIAHAHPIPETFI